MSDKAPHSTTDTRALRDAFGSFATGITLVTTEAESGPVGFIANSFSSLSLDPPLVMWAISKTARRHPVFTAANHFSVHILRADQEDLCKIFTQSSEGFPTLETDVNEHGVPVLKNYLARFDCEKHAIYSGGDHDIILGKVIRFDSERGPGLVYHQSQYFKLGL